MNTPSTAQCFDAQTLMRAELVNSAIGDRDKTDGYTCASCRNKGYIAVPTYADDLGYWTIQAQECKCMRVRRSLMRLERSGLKHLVREYTFERYQAIAPWQQYAKGQAEKYAKNPQGWFFIGGQSGSGKTHLCTAICRQFLLDGREVRYMLWRDDAAKLKACVTEADKYVEAVTPYKMVDVLYIDDLFKVGRNKDGTTQQPTQGDINLAFEILNARYNNPALLTIISSECTIDAIIALDEATGGRIAQRAGEDNAITIKRDTRKNYRLTPKRKERDND